MDLTDDELAVLRSAFEWARSGDTAQIKQFLDVGGPANLTNERGDTLLILAAYHSRVDTVAVLLDAGADVERVNDNGQTALGAAVFRRSREIVGLLLGRGADPHAGARSAVSVAEFFQLDDMAALLIEPTRDS
ncbi:ankyrin repeat domain-containing protein [Rhodococcoides yunnanense]|uniref:ankyrin repeat domain-containing protein n=1 Tax=Rhodococcoides yunnanense TaxID=278209 RepID=UPI0009328233|nr:ankyrin repeat domain-containing protein [Rhodococcus yunnanensis]